MKNNASHIKTLLWTEVVLLALLIGFLFMNRTSPPPPPHPPGPLPAVAVTASLQGRVTAYAGNAEGDVDKLGLERNGQTNWLHFPPHAAQQVMRYAPAGTAVRVSVVQKKGPARKDDLQYELAGVEGQEGGAGLSIRALAPPPPGGEQTTVSGPPGEFRKDAQGTITSFVLADHLVTLPPHTRALLAPLLLPAKQITVKGYVRGPGGGFVNTSGLQVVRPSALEIDGVSYLVQ